MGPKILLAKPLGGVGGDDDTTSHRSRGSSWNQSLNLLSDSLPLNFHYDRFLPFLTENTEFTVVGVIGPPGVGKSTIMNHLYAFDPSKPGMLGAYGTESDEIRATARHCSIGIEPRVCSDRLILLDTQPLFSPSLLSDINTQHPNANPHLTHEIINIQLAVFLSSVCHILLVVSEGLHDRTMWRVMSTVDLLKHAIPDPSLLNLQTETDTKDKPHQPAEYMATPIFVHTKIHDQDLAPNNCHQLKKMAAQYFANETMDRSFSTGDSDSPGPNLFVIPAKIKDECLGNQYESYTSMLDQLRDRVLSMSHPSFARTVSERDWLKNSAKIWELLKNSAVINEYSKALQSCGLFRR